MNKRYLKIPKALVSLSVFMVIFLNLRTFTTMESNDDWNDYCAEHNGFKGLIYIGSDRILNDDMLNET